ncbi:MAG: DUF542 domain-containing protein [Euryarchaeota archaeon]|nr:DUF542 domain-containing protein [Euryarchaeota archaeon]
MITKDMTLAEVLRGHPQTRQVLLAHGFCDCCGGNLTLEEGARARGISVEKLLKALNINF